MTPRRAFVRSSWHRLIGAATVVSVLAMPTPAAAEPTQGSSQDASVTPAPAPPSTPEPSGTPEPSRTPEPSGTPTPGVSASGSTASSVSSIVPPAPAAAAVGPLTLTVTAAGSPVAGHFFEDVGAFALSGSAGGAAAGTVVTVYRRPAGQPTWSVFTRAATDSGSRYRTSAPVRERNTFVFLATVGGAPGQTGVVASSQVSVRVEDSSVVMNPVVKSIDALRNPRIGGRVIPGRPGVPVDIEVKKSGKYVAVAKTRTAGNGSFSALVSYGQGTLGSFSVRSTYHAQNRPRTESTGPQAFTRAAVLHAVVTRTTATDVAKTYHAGCPVGPSRLRTVTMNFYGFDARMHRGVLVVRSDLATKVIRGFGSALAHRFPIAKMNNPNVYGGNDPRQMAADNTSAFNCRKVVGNPYQMSPHSYGIAVDVNTVQNPYRDVSGRWWPSNGRSYLDRTPLRRGMLGTTSYLTRSLRHDAFFWGGFWYPGRDYQHFEYRP